MFLNRLITKSTAHPSDVLTASDKIKRLGEKIETADAIVIGSGAGLSTAAGFLYTGERFERYFRDFSDKYRFKDMYSGGFYPFETLEENWAYWSRYVYINRYMHVDNGTYKMLVELFGGRESFIISTNVDHQWQAAGWDKQRLFYTQGDYGLWQCSKPCHEKTYDNEETIRQMVLAQGYAITENDELVPPEDGKLLMRVPSDMLPCCPVCGRPMSMNLRADDTFVQDDGWKAAAGRYQEFLDKHSNDQVLYLELGVGYNTPGIIKYPFWQMTHQNLKATYACINFGEAAAPQEIVKRSICIDGDIKEVLEKLHM